RDFIYVFGNLALLPFLNHLVKAFFIIGMIGPHYPIPKVKVQAVITLYQTVVHVIMGGRIVPFKQLVARKPIGEEFVTKVACYIQKQRRQGKNGYRRRMMWNGESNQRYDADLDHRLDRMESIGRKGGGING